MTCRRTASRCQAAAPPPTPAPPRSSPCCCSPALGAHSAHSASCLHDLPLHRFVLLLLRQLHPRIRQLPLALLNVSLGLGKAGRKGKAGNSVGESTRRFQANQCPARPGRGGEQRGGECSSAAGNWGARSRAATGLAGRWVGAAVGASAAGNRFQASTPLGIKTAAGQGIRPGAAAPPLRVQRHRPRLGAAPSHSACAPPPALSTPAAAPACRNTPPARARTHRPPPASAPCAPAAAGSSSESGRNTMDGSAQGWRQKNQEESRRIKNTFRMCSCSIEGRADANGKLRQGGKRTDKDLP